jgi:hypothetical protein
MCEDFVVELKRRAHMVVMRKGALPLVAVLLLLAAIAWTAWRIRRDPAHLAGGRGH